jgi:hypothetical protein
MRIARAFAVVAAIVCSTAVMWGQTTGVFFQEGWESGNDNGSFNSSFFGSGGDQFRVQSSVVATGSFALQHLIRAGMSPDAIQYATQHFGDAPSGPLAANGRGEHFFDFYVQYKIYYSPGFDHRGFSYKQIIFGTQDQRAHNEACCNPWVANYTNKQSASTQWVGFNQNASGYNNNNRLTMQTGRWYTIELRRRLNDPGVDNGIFQMWVDGVLISDYRNVRHRVQWNGSFGADMSYGTNFVLISDYGATPGSDQSVYWDDFKFSTSYIGIGGAVPSAPTNLRIVGP